MHDRVDWKTAPPVWRDALQGGVDLDQPAILRFASDDFMERLQAELDKPDRSIAPYLAQAETWRSAAGLETLAGSSGRAMKLYQPTHGRFYLTAGGLVCARYGLPDKEVRTSCGESVFHVLRRLEPTGAGPVDLTIPSTYRELGWVDEGSGRWVEANGGLVADEQRLPLFPMSYHDKRVRRMLAGFIPVANRQRYETAVIRPPVPSDTDDVDVALARPGAEYVQPIVVSISSLSELAVLEALTPDDPPPDPDSLNAFREATFFALLDLATFLHTHAPGVLAGSPRPGAETTLRNVIVGAGFPSLINWQSALTQTWDNREVVVDELEDPPRPVTDLTVDNIAVAVANLDASLARQPPAHPFAPPPTLTGLLLDVYDPPASTPGGGPASATAPPTEATANDGAVYVSRFVYERPLCRQPDRLRMSRSSPVFGLAHFYDPDAPFRDNRIALPIDTSIEGLRKFPKAVRLDMSKQLRQQMDRIEAIKLGDLDDGNIPKGNAIDLGMICSLSIPIITICALVLLMIIVSLLNIVFFWLPLFKICLPKVD